MNPTTALTLVRAADGAVLLLAPGRLVRYTARGHADRPARIVARILGGRHLVHAALTGTRPSGTALRIGVAVDAAHAATALALAALDPHRRRAGLANALSATAFATAGAVLAHRGG